MTNQFNKNYKDENPFNLHYINNEINEYGNISEFEVTNTVSEEATIRTAFIAGNKDENSLTNIIFFKRHPELNKNERLKPHQKELINEWLSIRNNIVRPTVADLKSKGKASTNYSQPALDKPLDFVPEPIKLPPENPVEFAPEPVGTTHWPVRPVRTEDKDWHVVSYRFGPGRNDFVRGRNTAREFYASRGVDRLHAAIDLYGNAGDQVVAIQDGIFLYAIVNFLGDTSAMYIQHTIDQPNLIFVYGEVAKYSWTTFNLKIGDKVKAGQVIAKLGITPGGSSMLHCETWGLGVTGIKNRLHSSFRSWKKGGQPPKYVLNPTKYLLAVRKQELERRKQQQSSPASTYKSTFNESLVPNESESFFGSVFSDVRGRLTWGKEYDTISSAYRAGNQDENSLTNIIFFKRHPELNKNERLKPHQKELIKEWLHIRNNIVRPIIAELKKKPPSTTGQQPPDTIEGLTDKIRDDIISSFNYQSNALNSFSAIITNIPYDGIQLPPNTGINEILVDTGLKTLKNISFDLTKKGIKALEVIPFVDTLVSLGKAVAEMFENWNKKQKEYEDKMKNVRREILKAEVGMYISKTNQDLGDFQFELDKYFREIKNKIEEYNHTKIRIPATNRKIIESQIISALRELKEKTDKMVRISPNCYMTLFWLNWFYHSREDPLSAAEEAYLEIIITFMISSRTGHKTVTKVETIIRSTYAGGFAYMMNQILESPSPCSRFRHPFDFPITRKITFIVLDPVPRTYKHVIEVRQSIPEGYNLYTNRTDAILASGNFATFFLLSEQFNNTPIFNRILDLIKDIVDDGTKSKISPERYFTITNINLKNSIRNRMRPVLPPILPF